MRIIHPEKPYQARATDQRAMAVSLMVCWVSGAMEGLSDPHRKVLDALAKDGAMLAIRQRTDLDQVLNDALLPDPLGRGGRGPGSWEEG